MSKIVVSHNFQRLSALLKGLGDRKGLQKAVSRSIKRTLPGVQKTAVMEIRSRKMLRLRSSELKNRIRSYSVIGASKPIESQYGKIWITPKAESLAHFYARRVRSGTSKLTGVPLYSVRVNAYGSGALKDPGRSFLVNRGQGMVVLARLPGAKRLPLTKLRGPGLAELVLQAGMVSMLARVAEQRYAAEFDTNVEFYAQAAVDRARREK